MFVRKFFGVVLLLTMLALPQTVSATKTDWFDRNFNFRPAWITAAPLRSAVCKVLS